MPKKVHRRNRRSRRGGGGTEPAAPDQQGAPAQTDIVTSTLGSVTSALGSAANTVGSAVGSTLGSATSAVGSAVGSATSAVGSTLGSVGSTLSSVGEKTKETGAGFWSKLTNWGSNPPAVQNPQNQNYAAATALPGQNPVGGASRRRRHRKSKGLISSIKNFFGTKKQTRRRRHGGLGQGLGYNNLIGANFPSAANSQGNNIYDLAKYNALAEMKGGSMYSLLQNQGYNSQSTLKHRPHYGGGSNMFPLNPAPYNNHKGGKSKKHRKRHHKKA
jgi:hypothetical protein